MKFIVALVFVALAVSYANAVLICKADNGDALPPCEDGATATAELGEGRVYQCTCVVKGGDYCRECDLKHVPQVATKGGRAGGRTGGRAGVRAGGRAAVDPTGGLVNGLPNVGAIASG